MEEIPKFETRQSAKEAADKEHEVFLRETIAKLEEALAEAEPHPKKTEGKDTAPKGDSVLSDLFDEPDVASEKTPAQRIGRKLEEYRTALEAQLRIRASEAEQLRVRKMLNRTIPSGN